MGKMQRTKGKAFERKIARSIRERWPDAVVRRSSQAERAYQSDVFVERGTPLLESLWLELHDAANPRIADKLEQAQRDADEASEGRDRLPVVLWHRKGERSVQATMPAWVYESIRGLTELGGSIPLTIDVDDFFALVGAAP